MADLFTVVAKLTLDPTEYNAAMAAAQTQAQHSDLDTTGTLRATDEFSETYDEAKDKVDPEDLSAEGLLSVDDTGVTTGLGNASESIDDWVSGLVSVGAGIADALFGQTLLDKIVNITSMIGDMVQGTADYADTVDKGAQAMGMTTRAYQQWDYVLRQNGADMSIVRRGWMTLTEAMSEAGEISDGAAAAFDALQIDPTAYETTEELFTAVIQGLAQMEASADRDTIVRALFGNNGTRLNAMLNSGVDGIEELMAALGSTPYYIKEEMDKYNVTEE